jgi:arabinose-5-phosphate isomerase
MKDSPPMVETAARMDILAQARRVLNVEIEALKRCEARLDERFEKAVHLLESCEGRVILTGMGKSGLIAKKIAATFSSTGTPAFFLHPGEGMHGDLGIIMPNDVVIAISNSGETPELLQVLPVVKHFKLPLIALTGNPESTLARRSEVVLDISVEQEACPLNLAPTASTTVTLVMGDALAIVLMERKGFTQNDFAVFHPAGSLGKRLLLTVEEIMRSGDELPLVSLTTPFKEALVEITSKKLGVTLVLDAEGRICGVVTDGDIRRTLTREADLSSLLVSDVYTQNPKTISKEVLAATALSEMERYKITVLAVTTPEGVPEGIVHMHDLLKTGL